MLLGLAAVEDATALTAAEDAGLGAYVVFESEQEALDTAEVVLAFVAPSDDGGVLAEARADAWVGGGGWPRGRLARDSTLLS